MDRREIPGFWYDEQRGRYFKIEERGPSSAPWTAENVKRRKLERAENERAEKRLWRDRHRVRRSRLLAGTGAGDRAGVVGTVPGPGNGDGSGYEKLYGKVHGNAGAADILRRELGNLSAGDMEEAATACWARGIRSKGCVALWPEASSSAQNVPLFYVSGGDERTGLGVAYGSLDECTLTGSYIPRNADDCIDFKSGVQKHPDVSFTPVTEAIRCSQMSSLKYYQPSNKMLLTSRKPTQGVKVSFFSPLESPPEDRTSPQWIVGGADVYLTLTADPRLSFYVVASTCSIAPSSSPLACVVGTSAGIVQLHRDERLNWLGPTPSFPAQPGTLQTPLRDILSLDFRKGNSNVVFAGGRFRQLWTVDMRTPARDWPWVRSRSAVSHVRSINEYQVLAAGPQNSLAVYDIRWWRPSRGEDRGAGDVCFGRGGGTSGPENYPLIMFPGFSNAADVHFGLDIEPALGVVAAAHDGGKVALFSLRHGARLRAPAVDEIVTGSAIRSLMFQTLPGDRHPSLFAGVGPAIQKYSFGAEIDGQGEILEE